MNIAQRFIEYTKIDTTSKESEQCPSTPNQFVLAHILENQLKEMGAVNVEVADNGFVYATIEGNVDGKYPVIAYLAHMDTSDATSGADIKARIIENYDGKDIVLQSGLRTSVREYPIIASLKGKTLIVTDGTTLLGGDDKAGIAIIMEMVKYYQEHPEEKHAEIRICFTPDEETGMGIKNIDLNKLRADYAYTLDGGSVDDVTYENFNAATAIVNFNGNSIHPGSAKAKMINAARVAMQFDALLPDFDRPEYTEGREGFNHLLSVEGECQSARSIYIIRNHDKEGFEKQKHQFELVTMHLNEMYGRQVVELELKDAYRNMIECFEGRMDIVTNVTDVLKEMNIEPRCTPIRGGTDGAELSYMGVPTPNLGTGGYFCHGNHELVCVEYMEKMVEVILGINRKTIRG